MTKLIARTEEFKIYPFGDIWEEYLRRSNVPSETEWLDVVETYEKEVLLKRMEA